jgi:hypothetical protein
MKAISSLGKIEKRPGRAGHDPQTGTRSKKYTEIPFSRLTAKITEITEAGYSF